MSDTFFAPTRPTNLATQVYEHLRIAIATRKIPPGAKVSEAALAAEMRVSKTPVREALLRLQTIGLIVPDSNRGGRVIELSRSAIEEAYEVREMIEGRTSHLAAERAALELKQHIVELADLSVAAATNGEPKDFALTDMEFHTAVGTASGNARLAEMAQNALVLASTLRQRDVPRRGDSIDCAQQHCHIADAILNSDAARAEMEAVAHVAKVRSLVLDSL